MKTKLLITIGLLVFGSSALADGSLFKARKISTSICSQLGEQDMGYEIGCLTGTIESLQILNDQRLERLSENSELPDVKTLRNATEIRKIGCSLKSAASPFGGRGQALSNRRCFLAQEIKLQAEILDIYSALQASLAAEKIW